MATLNITVDDAQIARLLAAYGVSTNAQLRAAVIADIKQRVINYEVTKAYTDGEASILTARNTVTASADSAKTSAEAISVT